MDSIVEQCTSSEEQKKRVLKTAANPEDYDCYKQAVKAFSKSCYNLGKVMIASIRFYSSGLGQLFTVSLQYSGTESLYKGPFYTGDLVSQQLNAIFVAQKLQLQNRTCKPLCDFGAILAIYRRSMRYNSRNSVTLSIIITF